MNIQFPEKLYYSIGEVAEVFKVNTSLLRFWEKEFEIIAPKKNKKGDRFYTPEDIKKIKVIYFLVKEKGYTLDGARAVLEMDNNLGKKVEIIEKLEIIRTELNQWKNLLEEE